MKTQNLQQENGYVIDSKTTGTYSLDDEIEFFNKFT